jgi:hypothetical protein
MTETITDARKRISKLYKDTEQEIRKANSKRIKPMALGVLLIFAVIFVVFYLFNDRGGYVSDVVTYVLVGVVVTMFIIYAIYSVSTPSARHDKQYSNDEVNALIREIASTVPEVEKLSDSELNAYFDPLHEYVGIKGRHNEYFDDSEYVKFLAERGVVTTEELVGLLFDIQNLYLRRQQLPNNT